MLLVVRGRVFGPDPRNRVVDHVYEVDESMHWMEANASRYFDSTVALTLIDLLMCIGPRKQVVVDSWRISQGLSAVITILLFFYAERASRRREDGICDEGVTARNIRVASFVRTMAGYWTILCSVIIIARSVRWADVPEIVIRVLP